MAALLEATGFFLQARTVVPAMQHLDLVPNLSFANLEALGAMQDLRAQLHPPRIRRRRLGRARVLDAVPGLDSAPERGRDA